uniref:Uncharacterized protein n=1 Tax=Siphoviridae sp. ctoic9 TaxID=2825671 RepID=A0A8S5Q8E8_9CAUD|nr:MAG TPA: hypothetical protein [Siphoviridae sp. ctoic9]
MCFYVARPTKGFKIIMVKCQGFHVLHAACFALNRYNVMNFSSRRCASIQFTCFTKRVY